MAPMFPLVVVVHADVEVRVRRLVEQRGMPEDDARARIAAQANDEQRRAVADVWLDNSGSPEELVERAHDVWNNRILPFAHNLSAAPDRPRRRRDWCRADPTWPDQARRIVARLQDRVRPPGVARRPHRLDRRARATGSPRTSSTSRSPSNPSRSPTNSPSRCCPRAIRASSTSPRTSRSPMPAAPSTASTTADDPSLWHKRIHASADPGPTDQRAYPGRRLAQSAVRPAVRRLADGQPRCARRLPVRQAGSRRARATATPQPMSPPRSRGLPTPTGGRGSGPTRPAGGPRRPRTG